MVKEICAKHCSLPTTGMSPEVLVSHRVVTFQQPRDLSSDLFQGFGGSRC